jgi:hypothetical protein
MPLFDPRLTLTATLDCTKAALAITNYTYPIHRSQYYDGVYCRWENYCRWGLLALPKIRP